MSEKIAVSNDSIFSTAPSALSLEGNREDSRRTFLKFAAKCFAATSLLSVTTAANKLIELTQPNIENPTDKLSDVIITNLANPEQRAQNIIYQIEDSEGNSMDGLKIQQLEDGSYLAMYHTHYRDLSGIDCFITQFASSNDLVNWIYLRDYKYYDSMPTFERLASGHFLVLDEKDNRQRDKRSWLEMALFDNPQDLMNCKPSWTFPENNHSFEEILISANIAYAEKRFFGQKNEGTPNIYFAKVGKDISDSKFIIGFHFLSPDHVDREAIMTMINGKVVDVQVHNSLNNPMKANGKGGNFGARELLTLGARTFIAVEIQSVENDMKSWRTYFYDYDYKRYFAIPFKSKNGSVAFANPHITKLTLPNGKPGIVFTNYIFDGKDQGPAIMVYDLENFEIKV